MSVVCCAPKGNARRPLDSILYCLVNCKWLWAATAPCRTDWYRKSCAPQPKNFSATHMNYIIKFAPFHKYIYTYTHILVAWRVYEFIPNGKLISLIFFFLLFFAFAFIYFINNRVRAQTLLSANRKNSCFTFSFLLLLLYFKNICVSILAYNNNKYDNLVIIIKWCISVRYTRAVFSANGNAFLFYNNIPYAPAESINIITICLYVKRYMCASERNIYTLYNSSRINLESHLVYTFLVIGCYFVYNPKAFVCVCRAALYFLLKILWRCARCCLFTKKCNLISHVSRARPSTHPVARRTVYSLWCDIFALYLVFCLKKCLS